MGILNDAKDAMKSAGEKIADVAEIGRAHV